MIRIYNAGICEDDIDAALYLSYRFVESIKIVQLRDIALHCRHILPDERYRLVQLRLPSPGDKNVGSFLHEALGRGQADPAIAPGDYSYLPIQCAPFSSPLPALVHAIM